MNESPKTLQEEAQERLDKNLHDWKVQMTMQCLQRKASNQENSKRALESIEKDIAFIEAATTINGDRYFGN